MQILFYAQLQMLLMQPFIYTVVIVCIILVKQVHRLCSFQALGPCCATDLHIMRFRFTIWHICLPNMHTITHTLTILVLTSFSMALTSSAALGTSEVDWRDVSKDED